MDLILEQKLTDEVIYIRSLWHHQRPSANPTSNPSSHLLPSKSKPKKFKKQKSRIETKGKKVKNIPPPQSDQPQVSDVEWPCPSFADPPSSAFEWPVLKLPPALATRVPTAEEQARFAATQLQQKALKVAQEFFVDSDSDGDYGSDEDDFMDDDEYEEYKFFTKVFAEDGELRGYYVKNCESGDFSCLVCSGIGKKAGKRFKDCVALVQHSNGIAKTKKKRAHRAFAQVICKVLGWNIDRLPTSGLSMAKSGECQGIGEVGMEDFNMLNQIRVSKNSNSVEMILKPVSNVGHGEELQISTVPAMSMGVGNDVMLNESHLKADDADMCVENLDSGYLVRPDGETEGVVNCLVGDANMCMENHDSGDLSMEDEKTEGLVNCLCRNLSRTVVLRKT